MRISATLTESERKCALRSNYARRQALVEIDVLASLAVGLTLDELPTNGEHGDREEPANADSGLPAHFA